jgi:hypothetical protein
VEIIGKVQNDLSVRVMASTDFGPEGNIGEFAFWGPDVSDLWMT